MRVFSEQHGLEVVPVPDPSSVSMPSLTESSLRDAHSRHEIEEHTGSARAARQAAAVVGAALSRAQRR
jgi:adenylate kinase